MKKNKILLFIVAIVCIFSACSEKKVQDVDNNIASIKEEKATTSQHKINPEWGIEKIIGIKGDQLICQASNAENFYYVLNDKDFSLSESFGVKGNAGNEWIMPHILLSDEPNKCYVIDNGTKKIHTLIDYKITQHKDSPVNGLVNGEKLYKNWLCYEDMSPDKIVLRIIDINNGNQSDSLAFEDPTKQGMSYKEDFAYDVRQGKLVLGQIHKDNIKIFNISDEGKLELACTIKGNTKDNTTYYTSVTIGKDRFYILSQKQNKEGKGVTCLEIYKFDGEPVKNINLGFSAKSMALNTKDNSVILLDNNNGTLKVLKL